MSYNSKQMLQFEEWINTFDPLLLQNEDDVETKFVHIFFRFLGFPDTHRRGKYPIRTYNPRKSGRKPEIDNIYFLTDNISMQDSDTSLLLVEAKEPNEEHLEGDLAQAVFYSDHLKPLFYCVTNSYRLIIFKRHRYQKDECIFDGSIRDLRNAGMIRKIYKNLYFDNVKLLKEQMIDEITHELHVELAQTLKHKPDILAQLTKGDFIASEKREGKHLSVSRARVAIDCKLPNVFQGGSCHIKFSSVTLRGLVCYLTHEDIMRDLLIGLKTSPRWKTRPFVRGISNNLFEVRLGQTLVFLSEQEALELCECIDILGETYKKELIEATDLLEAWNYSFIQSGEYQGFSLLSVKPWLWKLMKQFAVEFGYSKGNSEKHVFDIRLGVMFIYPDKEINVALWAVPEGNRIPNEWVDIRYLTPDRRLSLDYQDGSWKQSIGPKGIWTVRYTHEWIKKKYIPWILSHYQVHHQESVKPLNSLKEYVVARFVPNIFLNYKEQLNMKKEENRRVFLKSIVIDNSDEPAFPLTRIEGLNDLTSSLHEIQSWLASYRTLMIEASCLRLYYQTFTEIAKEVDPYSLDLGYIIGKLGVARRYIIRSDGNLRSNNEEEDLYEQNLFTYQDMLMFLEKQVERIFQVEYEQIDVAELISRAFIAISEANAQLSQDTINKALKVITDLMRESVFTYKYIAYIAEPFLEDY